MAIYTVTYIFTYVYETVRSLHIRVKIFDHEESHGSMQVRGISKRISISWKFNYQSHSGFVVMKLVEPSMNKERNVTFLLIFSSKRSVEEVFFVRLKCFSCIKKEVIKIKKCLSSYCIWCLI